MPMAQPDLQVTERLFKPLHWNSVCLHICRDLRMVFFCSETLLYMTVILDVLILSFMTFSKSQHKVEETKWAHPRVAGPDVASCWITGVPVTLALWYSNGTGNHCHKYWLLFSKVRDDTHRVWQIDKILCHQLLFEQKSCGYHIVTWCCQSESKSLLTPEVRLWTACLSLDCPCWCRKGSLSLTRTRN